MANSNPNSPPESSRIDVDFIMRALKSANVNALRLALYHQTKDPELLDIKVNQVPLRGGAFIGYVIGEEESDIIRARALTYLTSAPEPVAVPSREECNDYMQLFTGKVLTPSEQNYGYEELAFDPLVRSASWPQSRPASRLKGFKVKIIGAGVSGLAMAIQLDRLGIDYEIIERLNDIGGTWEINNYPDARVDISTFLYQFKFEQNYPWKHYFATQSELKDYLNYIVDKYDLRKRIRFGIEMQSARWDSEESHWSLTLRDRNGAACTEECNAVVTAVGLFNTPKLPNIKGIERFQGQMFHTTSWDHSYDYAGKRIAIIGTGSTGTQLMPRVAEAAGQLTVFQRTPNWITPTPGYRREVNEESRWLLSAMPGYWNWFVYSSYISELQVQSLQVIDREFEASGGVVNEKNESLAKALKAYIQHKMGDRNDLYEKLVPNYPPLARRLVVDNGFYDALLRDNVELVAGPVKEITESGVVDESGRHYDVDLIVLAAGFDVGKYLSPVEYRGRNDVTLDKFWGKDGARAYASITIPEFPNLFMMYGPNSMARAGGFHSWAEIVGRYIGDLIAHMIDKGSRSVEVLPEVFQAYNDQMDKESGELLWEAHGQNGYYTNDHGRSGTNMPWPMHDFYERVRKADTCNFKFEK